jgi:5-methylcytosine-specific restriction endonuclease McrA
MRTPIYHRVRSCSRGMKRKVLAKTSGRCWYCGVMLAQHYPLKPTSETLDHLIPKCRGGTNDVANLVPTCRRCNLAKDSMTLEEYRASLQGTPTTMQLAFAAAMQIELAPVVFWGERARP